MLWPGEVVEVTVADDISTAGLRERLHDEFGLEPGAQVLRMAGKDIGASSGLLSNCSGFAEGAALTLVPCKFVRGKLFDVGGYVAWRNRRGVVLWRNAQVWAAQVAAGAQAAHERKSD